MIKKQTLPQRYLIQNEGPWEGPAEAAIAQSLFICSEHGLSDLHIVVASKDVLDGTAFSVTLGIEISASLLKGKPVVQDSVNITYSTPRIFKQKYFYKNHGVILAAYLPNEYIDQIDSTPKVHSIVFLPWKNDEGKRWAASWQPEIVGEKIWTIPDGVLPSEVHEELSQLTNSVNLETGSAPIRHGISSKDL